MKTRSGFTLIELLLVIGIIALLASIVIAAINPTKQLADARNTQRHSDVVTILNAVYQYSVDNTGNLPDSMTGGITWQVCNNTGNPLAQCYDDIQPELSLADLKNYLVPKYLVGIPHDPGIASPTSQSGTSYMIYTDAVTKRITVTAPAAENGQEISVTR
ncbi:MAG: type II secretion system protein [Candidatus Peribacteraceae bacterium]|nr:type II secretion system protein [Candidatus Peribacteraceae bacterium]